MSINGFRIFSKEQNRLLNDVESDGIFLDVSCNLFDFSLTGNTNYISNLMTVERYTVQFHTGCFDRDSTPIYEGDYVKTLSGSDPFLVKDIKSFLLFCGAFELTNGCEIFPSLEVIE